MCVYICPGYSGMDRGGSETGRGTDLGRIGYGTDLPPNPTQSPNFFFKKKLRIHPDPWKNPQISDPFGTGNGSDTDGSAEMAITASSHTIRRTLHNL